MAGFLNRFRCDGPRHGEQCPAWCDLRPGGASKSPPYDAKATTLMPGTHQFEQGPGAFGICKCTHVRHHYTHSDYPDG